MKTRGVSVFMVADSVSDGLVAEVVSGPPSPDASSWYI